MSNDKTNLKKRRSFFEFRYVTFSPSNVSVDLKKFLATPEGRKVVRNAVKRAENATTSARRAAARPTQGVAKSAEKISSEKLDEVAA